MRLFLNLLIAALMSTGLGFTALAQSSLGDLNQDGVREAILFTESDRAQTYTFSVATPSAVRFLVASTGANVSIKLFSPGASEPFMNVNGSSMDVTLNLISNEPYRLDITGPLNGRPLVSLAIDLVEGAAGPGVGGSGLADTTN